MAKFSLIVLAPPLTWNGWPGMTTSLPSRALSYSLMASVPSGVLSHTNIPPSGSFQDTVSGRLSSMASMKTFFLRAYPLRRPSRYAS